MRTLSLAIGRTADSGARRRSFGGIPASEQALLPRNQRSRRDGNLEKIVGGVICAGIKVFSARLPEAAVWTAKDAAITYDVEAFGLISRAAGGTDS